MSKKEQRARQENAYFSVGRVSRPHGIRGAMVVDSDSNQFRNLAAGSMVYLGEAKTRHVVTDVRIHKKRCLMSLEDCHDRDEAEAWRGMEVYIAVDDLAPLAEGEYYYWQVMKLKVRTVEGEHLGVVVDIIETGANDVYVVQEAEGEEILIPAIKSVIKSVDLEEGEMLVELLPGLR